MASRTVLLPAFLVLAGCGAGTTPAPRTVSAAPPPRAAIGVDRVMGHDAQALAGLFGRPALDVREGTARKLQYRGPACVLDAYLYASEGGQPKVTWMDARTPAGADIDRASCIAALARR